MIDLNVFSIYHRYCLESFSSMLMDLNTTPVSKKRKKRNVLRERREKMEFLASQILASKTSFRSYVSALKECADELKRIEIKPEVDDDQADFLQYKVEEGHFQFPSDIDPTQITTKYS